MEPWQRAYILNCIRGIYYGGRKPTEKEIQLIYDLTDWSQPDPQTFEKGWDACYEFLKDSIDGG